MEITFLIPTRNGAEFLEWSYNSIRNNQGNHNVEIFVLNDNSDKDNTAEVLTRLGLSDPKLTIFTNTKSERMGISGGYAFLAKQVKTEYLMHYHNDMYLCEGALDAIEEKFLIHGDHAAVCLTRIEHSMGYQPGPEKVIWNNAPLELEDWNEDAFLNDLPKLKSIWNNQLTGGHFAPFCMDTAMYHSLGGVDDVTFPLQSREDSDWAFRLVLAGISPIQIPQFVFHFASRGNRRNKYETNTLTDNPEWIKHNVKATRNFLRKWGTLNLHDEYLRPHLPHLYNVGIYICDDLMDDRILEALEPFCRYLYIRYTDRNHEIAMGYIQREQPNTKFDLTGKIVFTNGDSPLHYSTDVTVSVNLKQFGESEYKVLQNIHNILHRFVQDPPPHKTYRLGGLMLTLNSTSLVDYAPELIQKNSTFLTDQFLKK